MKVCKDCGKEVSKSAKVCPNCGKKLKKPIGLFIFLGIIILFIIGAIVSGNEEAARQKVFNQNEIATYENVNYSILSVKRTKGEEFFEADKGKEYILISLKIENKSDSKISYNELDWELVDSNGDEKSFAIWGNDNNSALESGNLNPGGTKTGTIAFEIPKGDKNLTLNYYDNIFNDERTFEFKIVD